MQYCCEPKLCPCKENCTNVPLNRREGVPEGKNGLKVIWVRLLSVCFRLQRFKLSNSEARSSVKVEQQGADLASSSQTGNRGFGLKTNVEIKKGQFVIEYRGEVRFFPPFFLSFSSVLPRTILLRRLRRNCSADSLRPLPLPSPQIITRDESYRRVLTTYKGKPSYYFLDYDGFEVIDAVRLIPSFPLLPFPPSL
jgi:hypothetical protein